MLESPQVPSGRPALARALSAAALAVALLTPVASRAQENADCLGCHGQRDFTTERRGRTVSLYVPEKAFAASIHGGLQCVNCHAD
ncbi:MAG: hypothetical protein ACM3PV_09530, partial [Betaproteobacteria bacterium]